MERGGWGLGLASQKVEKIQGGPDRPAAMRKNVSDVILKHFSINVRFRKNLGGMM